MLGDRTGPLHGANDNNNNNNRHTNSDAILFAVFDLHKNRSLYSLIIFGVMHDMCSA